MENGRPRGRHFKYAYAWNKAFSQRQGKLYHLENKPLVPDGNTTATTEQILDRFILNRCTYDVHRFLSRNVQIRNFLQSAEIDDLRSPSSSTVLRRMILLDERNNESVTRLNVLGTCKTRATPIDARELYRLLSQMVSHEWDDHCWH